MACILSWVMQIQPKILHDTVKSAFLIVTKFISNMTSHCSVFTELKFAILQWTNKDSATVFTWIRAHHLQ